MIKVENIIEIDGDYFEVTIEDAMQWKSGTVRPVGKWWRGRETGFSYESKTIGAAADIEDVTEDVRQLFSFNVCWRGVWDERVYFDGDDEYRGRELEQMYHVWQIVREKVRDIIRKENPHAE